MIGEVKVAEESAGPAEDEEVEFLDREMDEEVEDDANQPVQEAKHMWEPVSGPRQPTSGPRDATFDVSPFLIRQSETRKVSVDIFQTLRVKVLEQRQSDEDVYLVGTYIQRCLYFDPRGQLHEDARAPKADHLAFDDHSLPTFHLRVHGQTLEDCGSRCTVRKRLTARMTSEKLDISKMAASAGLGTAPLAKVEVCNVRLKLKLGARFEAFPFRIYKAELLLELESFSKWASDTGPVVLEFRPNLVFNFADYKRNIAVDKKPDHMAAYDLIINKPHVEVYLDAKGSGEKRFAHVPKMKVTFYLTTSITKSMVSLILPLVVGLASAIANFALVADNLGELVANNIAIGLVLIFLLPQIAQTLSVSNDIRGDQMLAIAALVGLTVMSLSILLDLYFETVWESVAPISLFITGALGAGLLLYVLNGWVKYCAEVKHLESVISMSQLGKGAASAPTGRTEHAASNEVNVDELFGVADDAIESTWPRRPSDSGWITSAKIQKRAGEGLQVTDYVDFKELRLSTFQHRF